jgi:DNA-binding CsgD family transcriptional regulator
MDLEAEIIKLHNEGLGLTAIARKLGISRGSVYGIITRARAKSSKIQ